MTDQATPLKFTVVPIPEKKIVRKAKPNPFVDGKLFPTANGALRFELPFNGDDDGKVVTLLTSQARKAAGLCEPKLSAYVKVDAPAAVLDSKGKDTGKQTVAVTIWTVPKISKPRKPAADAPAE